MRNKKEFRTGTHDGKLLLNKNAQKKKSELKRINIQKGKPMIDVFECEKKVQSLQAEKKELRNAMAFLVREIDASLVNQTTPLLPEAIERAKKILGENT